MINHHEDVSTLLHVEPVGCIIPRRKVFRLSEHRADTDCHLVPLKKGRGQTGKKEQRSNIESKYTPEQHSVASVVNRFVIRQSCFSLSLVTNSSSIPMRREQIIIEGSSGMSLRHSNIASRKRP